MPRTPSRNEGFEASHKVIKQVYACCTNRGGGRSTTSAMAAVMLWTYRTRLYECDLSDVALQKDYQNVYSSWNDDMQVCSNLNQWLDMLCE